MDFKALPKFTITTPFVIEISSLSERQRLHYIIYEPVHSLCARGCCLRSHVMEQVPVPSLDVSKERSEVELGDDLSLFLRVKDELLQHRAVGAFDLFVIKEDGEHALFALSIFVVNLHLYICMLFIDSVL